MKPLMIKITIALCTESFF